MATPVIETSIIMCSDSSARHTATPRAMQQDDSAPALANYYNTTTMHRLLSPICRPVGLRMNQDHAL